eukprot:scaffold650003_cov32-Prasinocladus_malaysianus.AAC.1
MLPIGAIPLLFVNEQAMKFFFPAVFPYPGFRITTHCVGFSPVCCTDKVWQALARHRPELCEEFLPPSSCSKKTASDEVTG